MACVELTSSGGAPHRSAALAAKRKKRQEALEVGAQWSKLQWLIAALGVGLGFGLQEIVANFVSGIVILFEHTANTKAIHKTKCKVVCAFNYLLHTVNSVRQ